jgi:acyl carrier protein
MTTVKMAPLSHTCAFDECLQQDVHLLIAEYLNTDVRGVTNKTHFIHDLGADFLDRVELMIAIEDHFIGVEITDDDIERFQVVGDLICHLASQQKDWRRVRLHAGRTSMARTLYSS